MTGLSEVILEKSYESADPNGVYIPRPVRDLVITPPKIKPEDKSEPSKQVVDEAEDLHRNDVTSKKDPVKIESKIVSCREDNQPKDIIYQSSPRRPKVLSCEVHRSKIGGEDWLIFVGLMNGKPYEVFGGTSESIELPKKYVEGKISKRYFKQGGKYDLILDDGDDTWKIKDIVKVFDNANHSAFTRLLSLSMRHGAPIQYMVEQLQRDKDADLYSFAKVMSRVLKKYIVDGTETNGHCPQCSSSNMKYQDGCPTCMECMWSKCG